MSRRGVSRERWALTTPWRPHDVFWHNLMPLLFVTRWGARLWADEHYGYIRRRPDLRAAPHRWRLPRPVRVRVTVAPLPRGGDG